MKYIMVVLHDMLMPIVFPDHIAHVKVAYGFHVRSAGHMSQKDFSAFGVSASLGMRPHPEDTEILQTFMRGQEAYLSLFHKEEQDEVRFIGPDWTRPTKF